MDRLIDTRTSNMDEELDSVGPIRVSEVQHARCKR
jgi:hypothetical protein